MEFNPPEGLVTQLSFGDLKNDIDKALDGLISALSFVEKFGWFLPPQYKTPLTELLKLLTMLNNFLDKTP